MRVDGAASECRIRADSTDTAGAADRVTGVRLESIGRIGDRLLHGWIRYVDSRFMLPVISADLALTKTQAGSLVTWTLVGAVAGGLIFGTLREHFGRIRVLT